MAEGFKKFLNYVSLGFKGMFMGAANDIPGVSGGTIAFITGIYQRLIDALSHFDAKAVKLLFTGKGKEFCKHIDAGFLLPLFIGMGVGILALAHLLVECLHTYPIQTKAFFFGLVLASAIIMLRNINLKKMLDIAWLVAGIIAGLAAANMGVIGHAGQAQVATSFADTPFLYIFVCGIVSICAMILPGISGSLMLQVMGMYEYIMLCISKLIHFDFYSIVVVFVFFLGCVTGILVFAKLLHWLLQKWEHKVLVIITGFVIGSLFAVWPWLGHQDGEIHLLGAILFFAVGVATIALLELASALIRKRSI